MYLGQFTRYLAVGLLNTAFGLLCIFVALFFFGFSEITANLFGYSIGFLISYALHRSWTFRNRQKVMQSLSRFAGVVLIAYVCNLIAVLAAFRGVGLNVYVAQVVGVVVYVLIGFLGSRYFAFKQN